jgi:hypothetical protein
MASPRPDINDMLLSQQASRRSQLLKSRIQASLLTIANWRLENEQEYQNDDIDTGRTSPSGTSCGSNDTLQSMINVVRYDCDGKQRELAVDSHLVAQNCEPWLHRDAQLSTMERVVKKSHDFKYLAKHSNEGSFQHENLSDEPLVKTGNVAPQEDKQGLPFSSAQITTPNAKRKSSRKSSMTGGDHIRIMKQYDIKLLDSMMQNTPTKSAATTEPEDIHQRLPFRGETEEHTSTQDEEIFVPLDSPNIISNENNGERQAKLLPKTSRMTPPCPSLERRVSQLMTMADDVQTDKMTILFPHAQRRSISGKREKLLGGTHQKRSNRCGTTASWWNPLSFRLTRNSSTISSLQQQKNRSLSSIPENKKVSWDDVPYVSEFPSME